MFLFPSVWPTYIITAILLSESQSLIWCLQSSNDFHQLHHWDRVHEMHSNDLARPACGTSQLSDGDRRSVAGYDGWLLEDFISSREYGFFNVGVFDNSFDYKIDISLLKPLNFFAKSESTMKIFSLFLCHFALRNLLFAPALNKLLWLF